MLKYVEDRGSETKPETLYILRSDAEGVKLKKLQYVIICDKYLDIDGDTYEIVGWVETNGPDQEMTLRPDKKPETPQNSLGLFDNVLSMLNFTWFREGETLFRSVLDARRKFLEFLERSRDAYDKDVEEMKKFLSETE